MRRGTWILGLWVALSASGCWTTTNRSEVGPFVRTVQIDDSAGGAKLEVVACSVEYTRKHRHDLLTGFNSSSTSLKEGQCYEASLPLPEEEQ